MQATAPVRRRVIVAPDAFVGIDIWYVPKAVAPATHRFRYRLAYGVAQRCVLRYDNERGKGDHRHFGATEEAYAFTTPERLMADFAADIARWND